MVGGPGPPQLTCQKPGSQPPRTNAMSSGRLRSRLLAGYLGWSRRPPTIYTTLPCVTKRAAAAARVYIGVQNYKTLTTRNPVSQNPANRMFGGLFEVVSRVPTQLKEHLLLTSTPDMVELAWHELMTEDLRAYEAAPGTPQQGNFDEHDLGDYIIERKKLDFYARGFDYNGSQLHGYKMVVPDYYPLRDLDKFFQENKSAFYERLAREITELGSIKVTMSFLVHFSMEREGGLVEMDHFFWNRQPLIISNLTQLREEGMLERLVDSYKEEIARWQEMGSGWVEEGIKLAYLEVNKYEPIRGGSYIPTPSKLRNKQAVINVKNKDDECLRWAIRAALFPAQTHVDRPGSYPRDDGLDFTGIDFPTPLSQISKIEEQN